MVDLVSQYKMPHKTVTELEAHLARLTLPVEKKGTSCPFDPKILQHAMNVDRRTCKRVVPMEVLVLGQQFFTEGCHLRSNVEQG